MSATAQAQPALLTDKQERFVLEYLLDHNASAAARRAGYSARSAGAELMRNPLVLEHIREELDDLFSQLRLTAYNILRRRTLAAFFDPRKLFDAQGELLPIKDLDPDTLAVLTINYDLRPNGDVITRVRSPNCHQALSALEKRYAQFTDLSRYAPRLPDQFAEDIEEEPAAAVQPPAPAEVEAGSTVPQEAALPIQAGSAAGPQAMGVVTRLVTGRPLVPAPEPLGAVAALLAGRGNEMRDAAARTPVAA